MSAGLGLLSVLRVSRMFRALSDVRDLPRGYRFLPRTPMVPAEDGEIMARWIDRDHIADLVTDDGKATVDTSGKLSLETTEVINIKRGRRFSQQNINDMRRVAAGVATAEDRDGVKRGIFDVGEKLLRMIRDRMEHLCTCMRVDQFSYNKGGLVISNLSWGMPSILNTVAGTPWYGNPSTATPVDNLLQVMLVSRTVFNLVIDRITMSTAAFRAMVATVEFQNKAKVMLRSDIGYTNLSLLNLNQQRTFAESVVGAAIELNDARYWEQSSTGAESSGPFQPLNKVILESSQYDNDPMVWDFANGVVTESIVSDLARTGMGGVPGMVGQFEGGVRGPTGYCVVDPGLNPPNVTMFGVARGFPRKHLLQANAVLDIGTVVDPIPITEVF